jgi:hypothetical protein
MAAGGMVASDSGALVFLARRSSWMTPAGIGGGRWAAGYTAREIEAAAIRTAYGLPTNGDALSPVRGPTTALTVVTFVCVLYGLRVWRF